MSYYDTMSEDMRRVQAILEEGKLKAEELPEMSDSQLAAFIDQSGTIYGKDVYAAYKLLESLSQELQKFYGLFSDHELPCESFEHAQAIWNEMKKANEPMKRHFRYLDPETGEEISRG